METRIREIPILFSTPMVRAILDERKSMTRRVIKPHIVDKFVFGPGGILLGSYSDKIKDAYPTVDDCPYGQPGDRLWVKESIYNSYEHGNFYYRADNKGVGEVVFNDFIARGWASKKSISSRFMPKAAARIWLEVTDVRVERLQEISKNDAWREGVCDSWEYDTVAYFRELWDKLNAKRGYGWETNPWLWVVSFRRVQP